ncbi:MAG: NAD(P)-dependent oxidoreductase [Telluria sp.]
MAMTKDVIVITGSSGHIGAKLIERLEGRYEIVGLDDIKPPHPPAPAQCIAFDIESDKSVQDALNQVRSRYGQRILAFVHLAAYYSFTGEPSPKYDSVNVRGTERLLRALQSFDVGRFIYSSSILVHAPQPPGQPINESSPLEPKWDYPRSKFAAEEKIFSEHGRVPFAIVRIAGVYDDLCHLPALAQQIARIYERKMTSHVFPGDSTHGQAAIHMDDLIEAIAALIVTHDALPAPQTLLLGEPESPSYAQLQDEIGLLIHGEPWETHEIPKVVAKTGAWLEQVALPKDDEPFIKPWMIDLADDHFELDIGLARSALGWEPKHRLMTTLPQMIEALKRDPTAWYRANDLDVPTDWPESVLPANVHR